MGFLFGAETALVALDAAAAAELGSVGVLEGSLFGASELAAAGGASAVFPGFGEAALLSGPAATGAGGASLGFGAGDVLVSVGAVSALAGGARGQAAAEFEAAQFAEEQANARAAAAQEEVQRRRDLRATIAAQTAIRAGRGVELFSGGSGEAIRKRTVLEAEEDMETMRINFLNRARRFGLAEEEARSRGRGALLGGVGTAATALSKSSLVR